VSTAAPDDGPRTPVFTAPGTLTPAVTDMWDRPRSWTLESYRAHGGYRGLERAKTMGPEELVNLVKASGLRGRGGAGLDADDPALGGQDVAHEAGAGGTGARADRGVDGPQVAVATEELEVDGGVPEHDRRLVAGGDHAHPLDQGEVLGVGE